MAALILFDSFITEVAAGTHANMLNASTDTIKAFLTNDTPTVGTYQTYGGEGASSGSALGSIAHANISETWPIDITNTASQSGGTITVGTADTIVATASGAVPTFRYIVFYNDTDASDSLIGYYDNGSTVSLTTAQVFTVDFSTDVLFTIG